MIYSILDIDIIYFFIPIFIAVVCFILWKCLEEEFLKIKTINNNINDRLN
ncbi:TPA: hypothetical protein RZK27_001060 [Campylobacter coli]|nr:hypothetical protein [Campylobacter coli]